jgi:hypothetical protein
MVWDWEAIGAVAGIIGVVVTLVVWLWPRPPKPPETTHQDAPQPEADGVGTQVTPRSPVAAPPPRMVVTLRASSQTSMHEPPEDLLTVEASSTVQSTLNIRDVTFQLTNSRDYVAWPGEMSSKPQHYPGDTQTFTYRTRNIRSALSAAGCLVHAEIRAVVRDINNNAYYSEPIRIRL